MTKSLRSARQLRLQSSLRAARKAIGKTQADLARELGKPQSFVAKYESGERRLDVVELLDVLRVLRVPAIDFLGDLIGEANVDENTMNTKR